ncbi:MAG: TRAP transporter substrate-binding protein [Deltaproteobacteria bacterium]|nr:TRAP transporter substrate-binding protein [Deltaproteobacteria bacterium]MBW2306563.1 TRAP transporter substrate-binding protein [Deltaproteobacteria bacterium]
MKRQGYWLMALVLAMIFSLIFAVQAEGKRILKYGHNAKQEQPTGRAALLFAKLVAKKTDGDLEIQVFPANQLGKNRQMAESLKMGAQDLLTMGLGGIGYINTNYMMMQVPYVFRSQEHIRKVVAGDIGRELKEDMAKRTGILMLAQDWDRMVRHIGGTKPIRALNDLKGYKVRAGALPPIAGFKALGASPVKIPLNEMYVAIQQGVADGAELPIDYFFNYSIYEVAKYLNLTYHTYGTQFIAINLRLWKSLKPVHQKALQEAANEAGAYNNKLVAELEEDYLNKLKNGGMEFVKTDTAAFQKALFKKIPEIAKNWPGTEELFYRIQKVK